MTDRSIAVGDKAERHLSHATTPFSSVNPVEAGFHPHMWSSIWCDKIRILGVALPLIAIVWATLFSMSPHYASTARILIESGRPVVSDPERSHEQLPPDQEAVASDIHIIESTDFAERVITDLDLEGTLLHSSAPTGWIMTAANSVATFACEQTALCPAPMIEVPPAQARQAKLVELFLNRLDVQPDGISRVLRITYHDTQPDRAAAVANRLAQIFVLWTIETKATNNDVITGGIKARLATLADQMNWSQNAVAEYRRDAGLVQVKDMTLVSQQISELSTQVLAAQRDLSQSQAQVQAAERAVSSGTEASSIGESFNDGVLSFLKEKEAQIAQDVQANRQLYGPKHPTVLSGLAALDDIRTKLHVEGERLLRNLRSQVASAQSQVAVLTGRLDKLKAESATQDQAMAKLAVLEHEAEANRQVFIAFERQYKQLAAEQAFVLPEARVISHAIRNASETTPNLKLLLPLSAIIMLLGSAISFVVIGALDTTLRSGDDIESWLGIPSLGLAPRVRRKQLVPRGTSVRLGETVFMESLRNIYVRLFNAERNESPRTIAVTSALPREGKTTIARSLALLAASAGHRVVLIDADIRRPGLHTVFGTGLVPGFGEWLSGSAKLADIAHRSGAGRMDVIPAGKANQEALRLFDQASFSHVLDELQTAYDVIIFDAPPVLAVPYTRMLCTHVDATVLIVRWGRTPRHAARLALKAIVDLGGRVRGGIMCMTNMRRHARYAYSDSATYDRKLTRYYAS